MVDDRGGREHQPLLARQLMCDRVADALTHRSAKIVVGRTRASACRRDADGCGPCPPVAFVGDERRLLLGDRRSEALGHRGDSARIERETPGGDRRVVVQPGMEVMIQQLCASSRDHDTAHGSAPERREHGLHQGEMRRVPRVDAIDDDEFGGSEGGGVMTRARVDPDGVLLPRPRFDDAAPQQVGLPGTARCDDHRDAGEFPRCVVVCHCPGVSSVCVWNVCTAL